MKLQNQMLWLSFFNRRTNIFTNYACVNLSPSDQTPFSVSPILLAVMDRIHYGEDGSHSEVHIAIERSLHFSKSNGCSKMRYFLTFKMKMDMFNLGKRVRIGFRTPQNRRFVIVTIV